MKKNCENSTQKKTKEEEIWWLATTTAKTQSDTKVARFHAKNRWEFCQLLPKT